MARIYQEKTITYTNNQTVCSHSFFYKKAGNDKLLNTKNNLTP